MRRIVAGWPRWAATPARADAERACEALDRARSNEAPVAAPNDAGAGAGEGDRLRTSEWVDRYPLGPLSTGVGFVTQGITTWRSWTLRDAPRGEPGPLRLTVQTLDGAIDCVSRAMIARAVRTSDVAACHRGAARARAVVMRAVINGEGWIAPIEASVDRADVALAQCVARAIHRPAGLVHAESAGVETVFVVQWGSPWGLR